MFYQWFEYLGGGRRGYDTGVAIEMYVAKIEK